MPSKSHMSTQRPKPLCPRKVAAFDQLAMALGEDVYVRHKALSGEVSSLAGSLACDCDLGPQPAVLKLGSFTLPLPSFITGPCGREVGSEIKQ